MQAQLLNQPNTPANVYSYVLKQKAPAYIARPTQAPRQYLQSWEGLLFVIFAHASLIFYLVQQQKSPVKLVNQAKPMLVSLIAPPAPQTTPEMMPIIEPNKTLEKINIKKNTPKKNTPEKNKLIQKPTDRLAEESTEIQQENTKQQENKQEITALQAAPVLDYRQEPATQKTEQLIEDVIEPPRFGVSYLNNPAPDYPAMSRRVGEEGRVVMKVLVSSEGAAADVQIEKSSGSERLDNAAMSAVKKWRFIPAKKNNQPLSAYVLVPMKFSLDS